MLKKKISNFINISTYWQFDVNGNIDSPRNFYSGSKGNLSLLLRNLSKTSFLNCVDLVFYDLFGPKDHRNKFISYFINNLYNLKKIDLSSGQQIICPVFVSDASEAIIITIKNYKSLLSKYYNLYSVVDEILNLKTFLELIKSIGGSKINLNWSKLAIQEVNNLPPYQTERLVGWKPLLSLEESIYKTIIQNNEQSK